MKNTSQLFTIIAVFFLLIVGCEQSAQNSAPTPTPTPKTYTEVKALSLSYSYHSNEVQADDFYKGKEFIIVGKIEDIGKTFTGSPYVILEGEEKDSLIENYVKIQVIFEKTEKDKIGKLFRGKIIKAKGTCDGLTLGNVIMSDAELK